MGILYVDHTDIEEFISAKNQEGSLRNFNISVGMPDTLLRDDHWPLIHLNTRNTVKKIKAKDLWSTQSLLHINLLCT